MALKDDIVAETKAIFGTSWNTREGKVVPEPEDIKLGNDAVTFEEAAVLYADLADSTALVDKYFNWFAADVYKSYLYCAAKLIRNQGGTITAFDGDRIMAVFLGDRKRTEATRCALQITYAVREIINPEIKSRWPDSPYVVSQAVGIDVSKLFVARTGIRGSNDLVWVGRAANYAAKMCSLRDYGYTTIITEDVYSSLLDEMKYGSNGQNMWTSATWSEKNITVYKSSWQSSF